MPPDFGFDLCVCILVAWSTVWIGLCLYTLMLAVSDDEDEEEG